MVVRRTSKGEGALPRKRRKVPTHVKAAADRAALRSAGKDPLDDVPGKPASPLDPPEVAPAGKAPTVYPLVSTGRPTKYKAKFAAIAKAMCRLGATDTDLADEFGVDTATIWRWQSKHPAFCKALKVGKGAFDDQVERALALRARGFAYDAVKVMQHNGEPVYAPYREYVPPDVGAAKLWLTNRRPDEWREKTEAKHTLDATEPFLKLVQYISSGARLKAAEGKPAA